MKRIIHIAWAYRIILALILSLAGGFAFVYSIQAHPNFLRTYISFGKNSQISPDEPILIDFSRTVIPQSYENKIKIDPGIDFQARWSDSNRKLSLIPEKFWKPETEYSITLGMGKSQFFIENDPMVFKFSTVDYPQVENFYPPDGSKDVTLDIEDPISVNFIKTTKDFFLKFDIDPPVQVVYQNNSEKTHFQLLPKNTVKEGQKYNVKIRAKYMNDSDDGYREIYSSSFETLPPKPTVWERNYAARIEQAKKFTQAKIDSGKYIDINLSAQILSIFEDGNLLDAYLVSTGKRGMETPKGTWVISNKTPRAWSKDYGLYMPYWMALVSSGKFGIHELPEWPGGYKEGAAHLGVPVSHGCVRLGVGPAKRVYEWADMGTPVVVY